MQFIVSDSIPFTFMALSCQGSRAFGEVFKRDAANRGSQLKTNQHDHENVVKELDELRKDPKKWEAFMAAQAERALSQWPGRKKK